MTTAATSAIAGPIAMIFSFNDDFVLQALNGLTHEELWRAPSDRNNPMLWVAGHVVQTRATVLGFLGEPVETGWGKVFDRGAPIVDINQYPSRDDIERVMRDVSPRLRAKLASLRDEFLTRPASMQLPGTKTVADELAFFALHDSYHVGQMVYIRKSLGYPGLGG
jgi:DinB superfamily